MNLLNNAVMNVLTPSFQLIIRKTRSTGRPQLCREANALSVVIPPRCDFCVRPDFIFLAGLVVKREAQTELEIGNLLPDDFPLCFDIDHLTRCANPSLHEVPVLITCAVMSTSLLSVRLLMSGSGVGVRRRILSAPSQNTETKAMPHATRQRRALRNRAETAAGQNRNQGSKGWSPRIPAADDGRSKG